MDIYPLNGDRYCWVGVDDSGGTPPTGGTWKLKFDQIAGSSGGRYDAWMVLGQKGYCDVTWDAPSPGGTISIPGTARKAIAVGAYVTRTSWTNFKGGTVEYVTPAVPGELASFSSEGPTRDGRIKPDLAAPGMGIGSSRARTVSTKSADGKLRTLPDKQHLVLEGTSMAAPHVTGAAAQLLSLDPTLTVNEVRVLLTLNARTDGFTGGGLPTNHWGSGKLDVFAAAQDLLGPL
jgi:subtilisin family serine protease